MPRLSKANNFVTFMYCAIRREQYGAWRWDKYTAARLEFRRTYHPKLSRCALCGGRMQRSELSIDHIIPRWALVAYDLPQLDSDPRNFRLTHEKCNWSRGADEELADLSPTLRARIEAAHEAWVIHCLELCYPQDIHMRQAKAVDFISSSAHS